MSGIYIGVIFLIAFGFLIFGGDDITKKRFKRSFHNIFGCYPPVKKFGTEYDEVQTYVVIRLHGLRNISLNCEEFVAQDKKEIESLPEVSPRDIIDKINRLKIYKVKILKEEKARNLFVKACEFACGAGYEEEAKFFGYGLPTEDDQD